MPWNIHGLTWPFWTAQDVKTRWQKLALIRHRHALLKAINYCPAWISCAFAINLRLFALVSGADLKESPVSDYNANNFSLQDNRASAAHCVRAYASLCWHPICLLHLGQYRRLCQNTVQKQEIFLKCLKRDYFLHGSLMLEFSGVPASEAHLRRCSCKESKVFNSATFSTRRQDATQSVNSIHSIDNSITVTDLATSFNNHSSFVNLNEFCECSHWVIWTEMLH